MFKFLIDLIENNMGRESTKISKSAVTLQTIEDIDSTDQEMVCTIIKLIHKCI